ncbi:MAG: hypothetical protein ACYC0V_07640 [Armatimonadota bacterium]
MRFVKLGIILGIFAVIGIISSQYCNRNAHQLPSEQTQAYAAIAEKLQDIPKDRWQVYCVISAQPEPYRYRLAVYKPLIENFRWSIRRDKIKFEIRDTKGHIIDLQGKPDMILTSPEVMPPQDEIDPQRKSTEGVYIPLVIDPSMIAPGIYTVRAFGTVDAVDSQTGEPVIIPEFSNYIRIYISPRPGTIPSMTIGHRFLFDSKDSEHPYVDALTRKSVSRNTMNLRVLNLVQVDSVKPDKRTFIFTMDRYQGRIEAELAQGVDKLPSLNLLVDDDTVAQLRRKYEGKKVWQYGGAGSLWSRGNANESFSVSGPITTSWVIRKIVRAYTGGTELRIGRAPGLIGGDTESAFTVSNPLFVTLSPSKPMQFEGFSGWESNSTDPDAAGDELETMMGSKPRSGVYYMIFADAWDFEREYSLSNPMTTHPEWSALMRKAVIKGELRKGMTHDMVAWVMGWPGEYGTIPVMRLWKEWRYDSLPPFSYMVYFKNGRVTKFGTNGSLP